MSFLPSEDPDTVLHPDDAPRGWTTDPEEMDCENECVADDSIGQQLASEHGLGRAYPIMCHPEYDMVMFMTGRKFYVFDPFAESINEICYPTSLEEILWILSREDMNGLVLRRPRPGD